ncbi:MAG: DUF779 domain-containing protein [Propioniciclava sp.]|uniref:DUF779 domain-containing protein n=1 Tax=Propioniciclava sp. TaxID=2038686 RepID=UPI0039E6EB0F
MSGEWSSRALVTARAAELLRRLRDDHGALMMHQSGGCCDGSAPMCYPDGEFIIGDRDVLLGRLWIDDGVAASEAAGASVVPVWISGSQFEAWKHTQLVIDAVPGRGAGFSLESPTGMRFLTRSRVFPPEVLAGLPAPRTGAEVEQGASLPDPLGPMALTGELADVCPLPSSRAAGDH